MIWIFITLFSAWFGYELIAIFAPPIWDSLSIIGTGIPVGFTLVSWFFLLLHNFLHFSKFIGTLISLFLMIASIFLHSKNHRKISTRLITREFFYLISFLMIICYVITDKSMLKDGIYSSGTVYSDIPFHTGIISSFAYGANSDAGSLNKVKTPFYYGEYLSYPIIPDFFSSILISCGGASIRVSIAIPTMMILFSFFVVLHAFGYQLSSEKYVPELTVILWTFSSGTGWKFFFDDRCRRDPNANMSHHFCSGHDTFWINPLIHFLFPQRSGLNSMPLVVQVLSLLVFLFNKNFSSITYASLAGFLMGLIPLISAHSFIAGGEYAIFMCLISFPWFDISKWIERIKIWGCFGIVAWIIAIPQVLWLLRVPRKGFMEFIPLWKETNNNSRFGFWIMWWESLGSFFVISIFLVWIFLTPKQIRIYIPSVCLFIISNFIRYQPGAMDNNKVFFAGFMPFASAFVGQFFVLFLKFTLKESNYRNDIKIKIHSIFLYLILFSIMFSSLITIYKAWIFPFNVYSVEDYEIGKWAMKYTSKNSVFFTLPFHNNPFMSIGGRVIWIGYEGWVWTHGLDLGGRQDISKQMIKDMDNYSIWISHNIKYIVNHINDHRDPQYPFPDPSLNSSWTLILDIPKTKVYRLLSN